ncbi:MAG TPA: hypothetical protein VJJ02_01445 [Candidatus Paceibacterota bacterium]
MKQFTATIWAKDDFDTIKVVGEGDSPEEAMNRCLEKSRVYIEVAKNLPNGVTIPAWVAQKMPSLPPDGQRFLLLVQHDDDDDGARYEPIWRIFAVTTSPFELPQVRTPKYVAGEQILIHHFGDAICNDGIRAYLPPNTKEFVNGEWITREAVGGEGRDG